MTRQIIGVNVRRARIGYYYKANLSKHDQPDTPEFYDPFSTGRGRPDVRVGWRLTQTGLKRYLERAKRRRQRRIDWHNRSWNRLALRSEDDT